MQTTNLSLNPEKKSLWHLPAVTVARLTLESYLRSRWMLVEFSLVLAFLAILFFPYLENTAYFNGTSNYALGAIAILGAIIMVRQATSARTYLVLARLNRRASYSRGLMIVAVIMRLPIYIFYLILVLAFHRLTDPTFGTLFWGGIGILVNTMLVALLIVALCTPIATRLKRMAFLAYLVVMLFSFKPIIPIPTWLDALLSITQIPLWPVAVIYTMSTDGTFSLIDLPAFLLIVCYALLIVLIAGRWLEKRELQFY